MKTQGSLSKLQAKMIVPLMPLRRSGRKRKLKTYEDFVGYSKTEILDDLHFSSVHEVRPFNSRRKERIIKTASDEQNAEVLEDTQNPDKTDVAENADGGTKKQNTAVNEERKVTYVTEDKLNRDEKDEKQNTALTEDFSSDNSSSIGEEDIDEHDAMKELEDIDEKDEMKELEDIASSSGVNISVAVALASVQSTQDEKNFKSVISVCPFCRWYDVSSLNMKLHIAQKHSFRDKQISTSTNGCVSETDCVLCGLGFRENNELQSHFQSKHGSQMFVCGKCPSVCGRHADIIHHVETNTHSLNGDTLVTRQSESSKRRIHQKASDRQFMCDECGVCLKSLANLKLHRQNIHQSDLVKCTHCLLNIRHVNLATHKCQSKTKHLEDKILAPTELAERKKVLNGFTEKEPHHISGKPFKCKLCSTRYRTKKLLNSHINRMHLIRNDNPLHCDVCNKGFIHKKAFEIHRRSHSNFRPYRCRLCSKTFRQVGHVKDHLRTHGSSMFTCYYCNKSFKQRSPWLKHAKVHAHQNYHCPFNNCSMKFGSISNLVLHFKNCMKKQNNTNIGFICQLCRQTHVEAEMAENHIQTHVSDKYVCSQCTATFQDFKSLYVHMSKQHRNQGDSTLQRLEGSSDQNEEDLLTMYDMIFDEEVSEPSLLAKNNNIVQIQDVHDTGLIGTGMADNSNEIEDQVRDNYLTDENLVNNLTDDEQESVSPLGTDTKNPEDEVVMDGLVYPTHYTEEHWQDNIQAARELRGEAVSDERGSMTADTQSAEISTEHSWSTVSYNSVNSPANVKHCKSPADQVEILLTGNTDGDYVKEFRSGEEEHTVVVVTEGNHLCLETDSSINSNIEEVYILPHNFVKIAETGETTVCIVNGRCTNGLTGNWIAKSRLKMARCDVCGKTFRKHCELQYHRNVHLPNAERKAHCKVCGRGFANQRVLKIHSRTHTGERPFTCSVCGKSFRQRGHLKTHKQLHDKDSPFKCLCCSSSFITNSKLRLHMRQKHSQEFNSKGAFKCNICSERFRLENDLNNHRLAHFSLKQRINILNRFATSPLDIDSGIELTEAEDEKRTTGKGLNSKLMCHFCGVALKSKKCLDQHLLHLHTEQKYRCELCRKLFMNSHRLSDHMTRCHSNHHQCDQCGEVLSSQQHLRRHVQRLHSRRQLTCGKCDRWFNTQNAFVNHLPSCCGLEFAEILQQTEASELCGVSD